MNDERAVQPGWFYVIRLSLEGKPALFKLGWTGDVMRRLKEHRMDLNAPRAVVIQTWPCLRGWEMEAIREVTSADSEHVRGEVFRCHDEAALIGRASHFFAGQERAMSADELVRPHNLWSIVRTVRFFLRMPADVHAALVVRARREQRSLNSQIVFLLRRALDLPLD